ncbi:MAG: carboxypeptidase regulatory-like domain-containing protein [Candidatus Saccharicenans sp.]
MSKLKNKLILILLPLFLAFSFSMFPSDVSASVKLTGSLKGKVTDKQGKPINGAYLYITSPKLVGINYFLTMKSGFYHFMDLPAGNYKLTIEAPGYITAIINGIIIETGKTIDLPITLEPSEKEEEKILLIPLPLLDRENPKLSFVIDRDLLTHTPRPKDLASLINLAPGVSPENPPYDLSSSINGSRVSDNVLVVSGNEANNPLTQLMLKNINVDWIEEVEVEAAGRPVENYNSPGALINVITRQGGNDSFGEFSLFATGGNLSQSLWSQSDLERMAKPPVIKDKYFLDSSLSFGGAILPDRIWYFANFRFNQRAQSTPFSPWRDPSNIPYPMYSWKAKDSYSLLHLTSQVMPGIKASLLFSFGNDRQNVDPTFISPTTPQVATVNINGENTFLLNVFGNYTLDQETFLNMFFFYTKNKLPRRLMSEAENQPRYVDLGTNYSWGSGPYNDDSTGNNFWVGLSATRFQNFLNLTHELTAGAEYQSSDSGHSVWKQNNLIHYYLFGNPYYYGQGLSPESGNLVGKGLVGFYLVSKSQGSLVQKSASHRLILFAQDNFSPVKRIHLSLGLRFERTQAGLSSLNYGDSGNSTSIALGNALIKPIFGVNPYAASYYQGWDNMIIWNTLSPRLGLVIDLFGQGKSLIKASYNQYPENLALSYLMNLSPAWPGGYHLFYWYDENGNGSADSSDTYELYPEDYRIHQNDYFRKRKAPGLKSPYTDEWFTSFEQQLTENLTFSLSYISRVNKNLIQDVLYDPDSNQEWYQANSGNNWWIPFTTTVPGNGAYGDKTVTVYFPSASAPSFFTRLDNIKTLKQQYRGWQLAIRKRMSRRWQFYASATWSRACGNFGLGSLASAGLTQVANSPNSLVNVPTSSRLDLDRPFSFRVMGTYQMFKDIYLSAYFYGYSGTPWARTVTIVAPQSWLGEHQAQNLPATVYLEQPGTRRLPSFQSLDLRLEKSFRLGQSTSLQVYFDLLNLLGKKYGIEDLNDGGYWYPQGEGNSTGIRIFNPNYQKILALYGNRTAQLNFTLRF